MATSARAKAERRAETAVAAIRDLLLEENTSGALTEAVRKLRSEATHLRRRRPADGAITDAQLAGLIAGIASALHRYDPGRTSDGAPDCTELLTAFRESLARSTGDFTRKVTHAA